jgi:hypothetical protein
MLERDFAGAMLLDQYLVQQDWAAASRQSKDKGMLCSWFKSGNAIFARQLLPKHGFNVSPIMYSATCSEAASFSSRMTNLMMHDV